MAKPDDMRLRHALTAEEGKTLLWDQDNDTSGEAELTKASSAEDAPGEASFSSPAPKYSKAQKPVSARPVAPVRQLTPDELLAKAHEMLQMHKAQADSQLDQGPSVGGDVDANGKRLPDWLHQYGK